MSPHNTTTVVDDVAFPDTLFGPADGTVEINCRPLTFVLCLSWWLYKSTIINSTTLYRTLVIFLSVYYISEEILYQWCIMNIIYLEEINTFRSYQLL